MTFNFNFAGSENSSALKDLADIVRAQANQDQFQNQLENWGSGTHSGSWGTPSAADQANVPSAADLFRNPTLTKSGEVGLRAGYKAVTSGCP